MQGCTIKFSLLLLVALLSTLTHAQSISLFGTVIDDDLDQPVEFATVTVLRAADSSVIGGAVAGAGGRWQVEGVEPTNPVIVSASFIGYETSFTEPIALGEAPAPLTLHLRSAPSLLNAVEVTGRKLSDIHRLDRQEYDAGQFKNAGGGSATDVIANLPAVAVNSFGEVTVRGATGFLVLIDGRPLQGNPATLLAQLPANAIAKVEIITTPGAQYDPDGKAGIINIVTRANALDGWSLAANLNYGLPSVEDYDNKDPQRRYAADLSGSYRAGKWDLQFGADYRRDDNAGRRQGYVNTLLPGPGADRVLTAFPSVGERSHDRLSYSGRLGVGYAINKRQALQISLLAGKRTVERTADIQYLAQTRTLLSSLSSQALDPEGYYWRSLCNDTPNRGERIIDRSTYFNENLRIRRGDFYIASLNYDLKVGKNGAISVSGLYERTVLGGPTDNLVRPFRGSPDTLQYQFNTNDNPLDGARLNLDYKNKIGMATWESGYQFRYLKHPGDFDYLDRDFDNGGFTVNPLFTNGIVLRRDVHAGYTQLSGAKGKLEYAAGVRLEYFDRSVRLERPDTTYQLNRLSLYPSANLRYRFPEGWQLKAGYSRRIDRTTTFKMTPFPEREHNETLEQGDAELLPELTDLAEIGVTGNWGDNSAALTFYYRHTRDVINRVNTVFNDTILNRIYTNVGQANTLGLELSLIAFPTGSDWRISFGGNVFDYQLDGQLFGEAVSTGNYVYSINATTDVPLWKVADLQLGINYLSARVTAQGEDSRFFNPYLNLVREFPKQRLTVTFQWQNISMGWWDNNQQRITTARPDFFTTTNYVYEPDVLRLGVGYRFTKLENKSVGPKSEFGDREF